MTLADIDHVATGTERRMVRVLLRQARAATAIHRAAKHPRGRPSIAVSEDYEDVWHAVVMRAGYADYSDDRGRSLVRGVAMEVIA